jgi:outer membrane protein assembly factor BamB
MRTERIRRMATPAALFFASALSTLCNAGDWPTWMGPNLDGVSHETGWSSDWPASGLPQVWTKEIGTGFCSVSIVDGLLYTMGHSDGKETIWCLQAETGDVVWSHFYYAELNANLYEGGPGSTPTVDGDFVYTLSIDGWLLCFHRKTGDGIWEKDLKVELDVGLHEWGFNSSPLILGQQVIVQGGRVVSFDKLTGEKNWQSAKHRAGYGSVRAFPHEGEDLLASLDCDGLRISRSTDGSQVAFQPWTSPFGTNSTTPIVAKDTIYISSGYNVGSGLFRLQDGKLQQIYRTKRMRNHFNNSILLDGYIYGMDGNSNLGRVVTLTCLNLDTGHVEWKQRGLGCGSLMIANNRLLILTEDGQLVVADARPDEYTELARSAFLDGRCWTVPVLLDGRVYGRNAAGKLVCVQLPVE